MDLKTLTTRARAVIAEHFGLPLVTEAYRFGADLEVGDDEEARLHFAELHLELENELNLSLPHFDHRLDDVATVDDVLNIVRKAKVQVNALRLDHVCSLLERWNIEPNSLTC